MHEYFNDLSMDNEEEYDFNYTPIFHVYRNKKSKKIGKKKKR